MKQSIQSAADTAPMSLGIIIRMSLVFIVLCGIVYPLVCTGLAQALMPGRANGSLIQNSRGAIVGSELIGQKFTDPNYFQGRVSSIDYKAEASGSNNYAPSNPDMLKRTEESIEAWRKNNPDVPVSRLPIDLITNSGSGLDPHISPQSAIVQVPRISKLTGLPQAQLEQLVAVHTESRDLGVFGEPKVNVLELNLALNGLLSK
ncbi:potassium-transporting ATPase subunit KdpC [Paenibacillus rigui]|uniref:Potassium-transporting ATPase KdpC subunit n=1 Tax=Paenibacillus rigui TaxID=554312 RepID=A0A229UJY3_9BACL|nr:potassium-transporting ATPase subunit KdpC [Paenibacillus rigui]OXM83703.1 potassium-transporting ATPase subunit C [Paenibacillus rigui]